VGRLRSQGFAIRPGLSASSCVEFETRWRVKLPEDMATFFQTIDGMGRDTVDKKNFVRLWPLEELAPATLQDGREDRLFLCADLALSALEYAVELSPSAERGGGVCFFEWGKSIPMADSWTEFLELYLSSSRRLGPG
jgi:SMI1/KNR4 family protein SUKH-1